LGDLRLGGGGGPMRPGSRGWPLPHRVSDRPRGLRGRVDVRRSRAPSATPRSVGSQVAATSATRAASSPGCVRPSAPATSASSPRIRRRGVHPPDDPHRTRGEVQGVTAPRREPRFGRGVRQSRAAAAQFAPPEGGTAVITVPSRS
jgi:hypothetical protein